MFYVFVGRAVKDTGLFPPLGMNLSSRLFPLFSPTEPSLSGGSRLPRWGPCSIWMLWDAVGWECRAGISCVPEHPHTLHVLPPLIPEIFHGITAVGRTSCSDRADSHPSFQPNLVQKVKNCQAAPKLEQAWKRDLFSEYCSSQN